MTPAFRLLCACCRWPDDDTRREAIRAAATAVKDWDEVPRLASRHRVEPLVAHGLTAAGLTVPPALDAIVRHHRALSLRDIGETLRIAAALDGAGIVHRFLKGAPLGARAYGNPLLKRSWDIDLLVLPVDAERTAALLGLLDYTPHLPDRPLDEEEFDRWSQVSKEAELKSPRGTRVELHWRVSDHRQLLGQITAASPTEPVRLLGERSVATFADPVNLAYLAVHGSAHAWSRLKWIADFNALLHSLIQDDRRDMIEQASARGVGEALSAALALAAQLFGNCPQALPIDRPPRLVVAAFAALADQDPTRIEAIASRARWSLANSWGYRLAELLIRIRGTQDRLYFPLPRKWRFLYPLLRLPLFALRRVGRTRSLHN